MKVATVLFLLLMVRMPINSQILVTGNVSSEDQIEVSYFRPINNYFNNSISLTKVIVSNNGQFTIKEDFEFGIISLFINKIPIYLLVKNGDSLSIKLCFDINRKNGMPVIYFEGDNALGQHLFNTIHEQPMEKYGGIFDLLENIRGIQKNCIFDSVKNCINFYINKFDSLFEHNLIDSQFYSLATTSMKVSLLNEFLKPFSRSTNLVNYFSKEEINSIKNRIFNFCPPLTKLVCASILGSFYINDYFKEAYKSMNIYDSIQKYSGVTKDFIPYLFISDKYIQENIWGSQLYGIKKLFPDEIGEKDYDLFKSYFPNSIYNYYLEDLYTEDLSVDLNRLDDIEFLIDSKRIQSLSELPQNVYFIDLWASWCLPCRQEFSFNNKLDSFLSSKGVKKLYISIDDSVSQKNWKKNIARYKLKGFHLIASGGLITDIRSRVYRNDEYFSIPRYFIIAKDGRVLHNNLPRPSEDDLFKVIEEVLNTENKQSH